MSVRIELIGGPRDGDVFSISQPHKEIKCVAPEDPDDELAQYRYKLRSEEPNDAGCVPYEYTPEERS